MSIHFLLYPPVDLYPCSSLWEELTQHRLLGEIEMVMELQPSALKPWEIYNSEGGRWGSGIISKAYAINPTTIGRYLKAFREAGLGYIEINGEIIEIP